jgi:hypothetical protein
MRLKSSSETARRQAQRVTECTLKKVSLSSFICTILTLGILRLYWKALETAVMGKLDDLENLH